MKLSTRNDKHVAYLYGDDVVIGECRDHEDAAAIVRAVNAMPACIEAMELVLDFLEYVKADLKHRGEAGGHRSKLRAALAAAKGGEPSNH